jgi:hypothetical protein
MGTRNSTLRHGSAYCEPIHDKTTCKGCRSTGHKRSNCPIRPLNHILEHAQLQLPRATQFVPATQYNSPYDISTQIRPATPATQYYGTQYGPQMGIWE